ncbi:unnamed protein product [Cyprideis torosa]|uniref:Uncharacterized protein n=1 Tax=Cyprideis torosa TaxID=163714 RepID=A0A7R8W8K9_9CRUS|nr:unnamed protein product [Cyprideis torosa]CAG0888717.1 unnamed protein product [Cyprideis torosa]
MKGKKGCIGRREPEKTRRCDGKERCKQLTPNHWRHGAVSTRLSLPTCFPFRDRSSSASCIWAPPRTWIWAVLVVRASAPQPPSSARSPCASSIPPYPRSKGSYFQLPHTDPVMDILYGSTAMDTFHTDHVTDTREGAWEDSAVRAGATEEVAMGTHGISHTATFTHVFEDRTMDYTILSRLDYLVMRPSHTIHPMDYTILMRPSHTIHPMDYTILMRPSHTIHTLDPPLTDTSPMGTMEQATEDSLG